MNYARDITQHKSIYEQMLSRSYRDTVLDDQQWPERILFTPVIWNDNLWASVRYYLTVMKHNPFLIR